MNYNKLAFLCLAVLLCSTIAAQNTHQNKLDSFSAKYITAVRMQQKQKIYMVTDKSVYVAGEKIWFKAFLLNSTSQRINAKSSFLFADLVNEKDSVIKLLVLDAANKQLNAHIALPDSLPTGYYWLRGYTRQIAATDTNSICVTPLYIINKITGDNFAKPKKSSNKKDSIPAIKFYPEGGSIITGVNTTVALCISNTDGSPMVTNGYIKDNRDTIIASFTTNKYGLGKFEFEPSGYRKYRAVIIQNGKPVNYPLTPFNFYTGQLSVIKEAATYKLRVLLGDSVYSKAFLTYIIGVSRDSLIFAGIGKGQFEVPVAEKIFPEGIATFYLFDKNFNLLSERSIYVHETNVQVKAYTDKAVYGRRDKIALNISITDASKHPVPSLITITAVDTLFTDLREQCLMPVKSFDEQATDNFFLARNECLTDAERDLMMLTKANTYSVPANQNNPQTAIQDIDSLLYIRGTLLNKQNEPSPDKILTLISGTGEAILLTDTTDKTGRFCFALGDYADSTEFVIEIRDTKGGKQNDSIVFDAPAYPQVSTPVALKQLLPQEANIQKKYLHTYYNMEAADWGKETLPRVTVKDRKKNVNYDESKRVSSNSSILSSDDLNERTSVGNSILRVSGMHMLQGYLVINGLTAMGAPNAASEPLLLVDGVTVSLSAGLDEASPVMSYLNSLNPKDIDFIEILKGAEGANFGVRGGNGVILVNLLSRRRELPGEENNFRIFYCKGIVKPSIFPVKDYGQKNSEATQTDNRTTLFWNGSFLTGDNQHATLGFYTSDIPATYKVTITGITINGDIIYKTLTFQSK
jgi:TonB-dependent Receptor Plug Domain